MTRVIAGSPDEDCQPAAVDSGRQGRSGEQGVQDGARCMRQRQAVTLDDLLQLPAVCLRTVKVSHPISIGFFIFYRTAVPNIGEITPVCN